MRRIFCSKIFLPLLAIILLFASCKKGDPGAAGAPGAAGQPGPTGPGGLQGPKGDTGTANVIYSAWLNVTYQPTDVDTTAWIAEITAPKLDSSILNSGAVKVYFNAGSDSANSQLVMALPIYEPFLVGAIINPYYQDTLITLVSTADVSSFPNNGNHYFQYRYVLIPGGITALPVYNNGNKTAINWNDYKQVKVFLGLKD